MLVRRCHLIGQGIAALLVTALVGGCQTQNIGGHSNNPPTGNPSPGSGGGTAGSNSGGSANSPIGGLEQLMLERINRARLRPGAEAARYGITVDEGIPGLLNTDPKPAVAYNATLALAARRHADDMLARDYFAHVNLLGETPFDRIGDAGYSFAAAGENLAWRGTTAQLDELFTTEQMHVDLFVDEGIPDRGHRKVMLNDDFREVGLSIRSGQYTDNQNSVPTTYNSLMAVQEYAAAAASARYFVLGVVYDDRNSNGQYDFGEGVANSGVTLGSQSVTTSGAGGYTFSVLPGLFTLTFASGASRELAVIDKNIKVDLANGTRVDINLGLGEF